MLRKLFIKRPTRKVVMRSTAWVIYKTTLGHTCKSKIVTNVFDVSNQYTLIAELFNDIANALYKQGDLICELRLVSEKSGRKRNLNELTEGKGGEEMAHNQYQFQQALSKEGIKLRQCSCSRYHFPVVEYTQGKTIRIYCQFGCGCVTLKRDADCRRRNRAP